MTAIKPKESSPRALLGPSVEVHSIAERCRQAWLQFLRGSVTGWGRRDLAMWLVHDYAEATAWGGESRVGSQRTVVPLQRPLDTSLIENMLLRTRERLVEVVMECATSWGYAGEIAEDAMSRGLVLRVRDERHAMGFAPVDLQDAALIDRVGSLLMADYLTRPADFRSIVMCGECGVVSFDWDEAHNDACESVTRPVSGVVPRGARSILPPPLVVAGR